MPRQRGIPQSLDSHSVAGEGQDGCHEHGRERVSRGRDQVRGQPSLVTRISVNSIVLGSPILSLSGRCSSSSRRAISPRRSSIMCRSTCGASCTCARITTGAGRTGTTRCSRATPASCSTGCWARCPTCDRDRVLGLSVYGAIARSAARAAARLVAPHDGARLEDPGLVAQDARVLAIVLPEDHDGHHRNPEIEFGDIFRFYDAPARATIACCRADPRRRRRASKRSDPRQTQAAVQRARWQATSVETG
jgi:hypothetical protein